MLQNVQTGRVQIIAIVGSVLFLGFIVELIRKRKIKEEYGLLWVVFAVLFLAISIWRQGLEVVSRLLGIAYAPAAFLLILIVAVFLILIQFSVAISSLAERNKKLVQEIGIMRMQLAERSGAGRDGAPDA